MIATDREKNINWFWFKNKNICDQGNQNTLLEELFQIVYKERDIVEFQVAILSKMKFEITIM